MMMIKALSADRYKINIGSRTFRCRVQRAESGRIAVVGAPSSRTQMVGRPVDANVELTALLSHLHMVREILGEVGSGALG